MAEEEVITVAAFLEMDRQNTTVDSQLNKPSSPFIRLSFVAAATFSTALVTLHLWHGILGMIGN